MPGFTDTGQRAVQMSKVVELHGSAASALDYPLLQVVVRVFVVVQDVPNMTDQNSNSSCEAPPRLQLNSLVVVALSETCTIMSKRFGRGELSSHCEERSQRASDNSSGKKHTSVLITPSNDSGKITVPGSPSEPRIHLTVKEVEWQKDLILYKILCFKKENRGNDDQYSELNRAEDCLHQQRNIKTTKNLTRHPVLLWRLASRVPGLSS